MHAYSYIEIVSAMEASAKIILKMRVSLWNFFLGPEYMVGQQTM